MFNRTLSIYTSQYRALFKVQQHTTVLFEYRTGKSVHQSDNSEIQASVTQMLFLKDPDRIKGQFIARLKVTKYFVAKLFISGMFRAKPCSSPYALPFPRNEKAIKFVTNET